MIEIFDFSTVSVELLRKGKILSERRDTGPVKCTLVMAGAHLSSGCSDIFSWSALSGVSCFVSGRGRATRVHAVFTAGVSREAYRCLESQSLIQSH